VDTLLQDLRYALRQLARSPAFSLVAGLALALGIGANTAIFSVVDALLLRPLPVKDPDGIVIVWENNRARNRPRNVVGPANFVRWQEQNTVFERMAWFVVLPMNLTGGGEPEQVSTALVTASFFDVLGVGAAQGRSFVPEDGVEGSPDVVAVSHGLWQRRFGSDPGLVGRTVSVNGTPRTVVGVLPPTLRLPPGAELWVPSTLPAERARNSRGRSLVVVARLKPGVSREQAQAEMDVIAARTEQERPDFNAGWGATVVPLHEQLVGDVRPALLVLVGAVAFVLLIACANVANLLLARATTREKEVAIRMALGAGRGRLVRLWLTESAVLGTLGGLLGVLLAFWALSALIALLPANLSGLADVSIDLPALAFALALSLLTAVIFGLAPALQASGTSQWDALKEGSRTSGEGAGAHVLRGAFVAGEVALALTLLVGAGLLIRSFARLTSVDPGFRSENLLTLGVSLPTSRYGEAAKQVVFFEEAVARIEALPGVVAAGAISFLPLAGPGAATSFKAEGLPEPPAGEEPVADVRAVTRDYLRAMRIPLRRGRFFDERDTADAAVRKVAVDETLAERFWPGQDPVGRTIVMSWGQPVRGEIVGVVGDVRLAGLDSPPRSTLYWHLPQLPYSRMTLLVRTEGSPEAALGAVRAQIAALDPEQPVSQIRTMQDVVAGSVQQPRFTVLLLGLFAGTALLLAMLGIYGVMAYTVGRRTREIGIRLALGAGRADILRSVLGRGIALTGVGAGLGLLAAAGLSRFLRSLLFEVTPTDPWTFAGVTLLLAGVALLACYLPARRATRVDPMVTLRCE